MTQAERPHQPPRDTRPRDRQLFIIDADTWDSLSPAEVTATADGMREMGLFHLPYETVDVWLPANKTFGWKATSLLASERVSIEDLRKDCEGGLFTMDPREEFYQPAKGSGFIFEIYGLSLASDTINMAMHAEPGSPASKTYRTCSTPRLTQVTPLTSTSLAEVLIVLLATRNAVKTTKENKLAGLGIGKKRPGGRYRYTTTISLPTFMDESDDEHSTPGKPKAPHLRRGHIRRQHYGPRNTLVKNKWIEPVFVNADREWTSQRDHYNLSL